MNKKLGEESAFPLVNDSQNNQRSFVEFGMSKRFYAACAAMQGFLAGRIDATYEEMIKRSYNCADELLKQENNEQNT